MKKFNLSNEDLKIYNKAKLATYIAIFIPLFMWVFLLGHIPIIYEKLELTETSWGVFLLIFGSSQILSGQFFSRFITPKQGTRKLIVYGLILFSITFFFIIFVKNYYVFLFIASALGTSMGLIMPSSNSHLSLIEEKTGDFLQPIFWAFMSMGGVAGAILAIVLLKVNVNIEWSFFFVFVVGIVVSFFVYFFGLPKKNDFFGGAENFRLPDKKVILFGIILFCEFSTVGIIMEWSPLWMIGDLNAPLYLGALILVAFHGGEIPSRLIGAKLINYFGEMKIGFHLVILGCVALFISITTMNYLIITIAAFIFGFATGNTNPIVIKQAIRSTDENIPTTIANLMTLAFSGLMIGPGLVGLSAKYIGMTFNMYLLPMIWGICAFIFYLNYVKEK